MVKAINDELILVFPSTLIKQLGYFQGLSFDIDKYLPYIDKNCKGMWRSEVEENPNYKQLIQYAILNYGDTILRYRRGKRLPESRLLDEFSVGIGGHVLANEQMSLFHPIGIKGLQREIKEELYVDTHYDDKLVALINDDSNEVGLVHFGLVHILKLEEPAIRKKEQSINQPKFVKSSELKGNIQNYESWSRICIENIDMLISKEK